MSPWDPLTEGRETRSQIEKPPTPIPWGGTLLYSSLHSSIRAGSPQTVLVRDAFTSKRTGDDPVPTPDRGSPDRLETKDRGLPTRQEQEGPSTVESLPAIVTVEDRDPHQTCSPP